MSYKNAIVFAIGLSAALSACTNRNQKAIEVQPAIGPSVNPTINPPGNTGTNQIGIQTGNNSAASDAVVPITLNESDMKAYGDTTNMTYNFNYLAAPKSGAITFLNGTATISLTGLPSGQSGTVSLDILGDGVVKLHGQVANVTLKSGINNGLNLQLAPAGSGGGNVNPSTGSATDLSINVTLDNNGPSTVPPAAGSTGGGNNAGNGAGGSAGNGANTTDPIAGWDGKSFLGNAKWTISAVNG